MRLTRTATRAVRRRQPGGAVLHTLIFTAGVAIGWLGWEAESTPAAPASAPAPGSSSVAATPDPGSHSNANSNANASPANRAVPPATAESPSPTNRAASDFVPMVRPATPTASRVRPVASDSTPPAPGSAPNPGSGRSGLELTNTSIPRAVPADRIVECQVGLVRQGFSPGSIDGLMGLQTRAAVRAFQQREGLPTTGQMDAATLVRLVPDPPVYTNYVVTAQDVERLLPLSTTWLGKSQQARLDFESVVELIAERTFSHPKLVRRLNPGIDWTNVPAGTEVRVLHVHFPEPTEKAAVIRIALAERTLQVFGADSKLLAHFPCSIAQRVEKRPVGEQLHVTVTAVDPNYTFDPAVFPESAEARELGRKLILQPGPNNPVGAVWIGLDKSGYGIHGTPRPEEVGRTESHGCFRLANWNARHLLQLVTIGTPVEVHP